MWLSGGDCCDDSSSSITSPSTCKIPCGAKLDGAGEAVEEFWRSDTPLPARLAWYAILESRMQQEGRAPQLLSDSEVFTIPKKGGEGPDFLRFINLLDGVGKMIFGGWLELIEDPYRHWQLGFVRNRGVTDCLAIRWAVWERAAKAGWCLSEQQWDIVKAFDMLYRAQLFGDVIAPSIPFVTDVLQDLLSAGSHAHQEGRLLDSNRGDNLGPGLFRRSHNATTQKWNEQLDARPWARRLVVRYIPMGLLEASIDLYFSGFADELAELRLQRILQSLARSTASRRTVFELH